MLFGYPIEATENNWLHDCLFSILRTIHDCIDNNRLVPEWPEIIPEDYREKLRRYSGICRRIERYRNTLLPLSNRERQLVLNACIYQNNIEDLLKDECNCQKINEMPEGVITAIQELFDFAFKKLTDLEIRDEQYQIIYDANDKHICPFCGCEFFDAPGAPREDLDHYLAKSIYPFAAVNLLNLAPMGSKCNQKYKLAQNILFDNNGNRRKSFFPYSEQTLEIKLINSIPYEGDNQDNTYPLPDWIIEFFPDTLESETWNNVFKIRERYTRDVLNPYFNRWLEKFSKCFQRRSTNNDEVTENKLLEELRDYIFVLGEDDMMGPDFLQKPVFEMLYKQCEEGNQRLISQMKDMVSPLP